MRRSVLIAPAAVIAVALAATGTGVSPAQADPPPAPTFALVGSYATGSGSGTGEVASISGDRLFVTNGSAVDIVDIADPASPAKIVSVDLSAYGPGITSVAAHGAFVAAAVPADPKTDPGTLVLLNRRGRVLTSTKVGALPDMVTFDTTGLRILVANEGEPNSYGQPDSVNPEGSVSVVSVLRLLLGLPRATQEISFADFNDGGSRAAELPAGVRVFGPGATVAQDLEPEYITVDKNRPNRAWVSLQEANAVAELRLTGHPRVTRIHALGLKDHSLPGNALDASDKDKAINITNWPVFGMYQPDAIASYRIKGKTYLFTANEGDARSSDDYPGFEEEARVKDVALDPTVFPDAATLQADAALGRLTISTTSPKNAVGEYTQLLSFGARSFSVWGTDGDQVWDSGDQLETVTAAAYPDFFNSTNDENNFDNRSDNKGPEPEGIAVGSVGKRTLAFVGLERIGGFVVYDVTKPTSPVFLQYLSNRDFAADPVGPDSGPEVVTFVDARHSPNGEALVAIANEVSGTVSLWQPIG